MNGFVSIIIPIYNVEEYIEETLQSALNQTYEKIEYILVDDCGTDESMRKAYRLLESDAYKNKVVKVIKHEKNKGVSAARNSGVKNSSSEYVYFMDSDDIIVPNCIEQHVNAINASCVDFTIGGIETIGSKTIHVHKLTPRKIEGSVLSNFFKRDWDPGPCNKLIRKKFLLDNKIEFVEGIRFEDILWSYYMAKNAKAVELLDSQTYKYIIHKNSFVTSKNSKEKVEDFITVISAIKGDNVGEDILALREKYVSFLKFNASLLLLNFNGENKQKKELFKRIKSIECLQFNAYNWVLKSPYWLFNMSFSLLYMAYKKFQGI